VKLFFVVGEKAVALMAAMVLGSETPINVGEDRLAFKVFRSEDAASYVFVPSRRWMGM